MDGGFEIEDRSVARLPEGAQAFGRQLGEDSTMDWLQDNWVWLLIFLGFIGMHLGHGGGHYPLGDRAEERIPSDRRRPHARR